MIKSFFHGSVLTAFIGCIGCAPRNYNVADTKSGSNTAPGLVRDALEPFSDDEGFDFDPRSDMLSDYDSSGDASQDK